MILGDSLSVMASLAEREGLRGKVQCIYFDPPYGIKFNSNFQWSTTSRDVKDGNAEHITREPEMVKAFRDTWKDGIHSYLSYIRDRLTQLAPVFLKNKFMLGDNFSMLDVAIAPLLWRLDFYGIELSKNAAPLLKYAERIFSRPAYIEALTPSEKVMRK